RHLPGARPPAAPAAGRRADRESRRRQRPRGDGADAGPRGRGGRHAALRDPQPRVRRPGRRDLAAPQRDAGPAVIRYALRTLAAHLRAAPSPHPLTVARAPPRGPPVLSLPILAPEPVRALPPPRPPGPGRPAP